MEKDINGTKNVKGIKDIYIYIFNIERRLYGLYRIEGDEYSADVETFHVEWKEEPFSNDRGSNAFEYCLAKCIQENRRVANCETRKKTRRNAD